MLSASISSSRLISSSASPRLKQVCVSEWQRASAPKLQRVAACVRLWVIERADDAKCTAFSTQHEAAKHSAASGSARAATFQPFDWLLLRPLRRAWRWRLLISGVHPGGSAVSAGGGAICEFTIWSFCLATRLAVFFSFSTAASRALQAPESIGLLWTQPLASPASDDLSGDQRSSADLAISRIHFHVSQISR